MDANTTLALYKLALTFRKKRVITEDTVIFSSYQLANLIALARSGRQ